MTGIDKRLDRLEAALKRQQDPVYTVTLRDGSEVICTFEEAWDFFYSDKEDLVAGVSVDREDYIENAGVLAVLCGLS